MKMRNLTKQEVIKRLEYSNWDWSNPFGESKNMVYRTIKGLWAELALETLLLHSGINNRLIEYNIPIPGIKKDIDARIFNIHTIDAKSCNPYLPTNYLKPDNREYFNWYFFYDIIFTCDYNKEKLTVDNCHDLLEVVNIKPVNTGYNGKFLHFDNVKPRLGNRIHGNVKNPDFKDIKEFVKIVCSI